MHIYSMYVFSKFLMLLHAFDVSLNSTNFIKFFHIQKLIFREISA